MSSGEPLLARTSPVPPSRMNDGYLPFPRNEPAAGGRALPRGFFGFFLGSFVAFAWAVSLGRCRGRDPAIAGPWSRRQRPARFSQD